MNNTKYQALMQAIREHDEIDEETECQLQERMREIRFPHATDL